MINYDFLEAALSVAQNSPDPNTKVGAVLTWDHGSSVGWNFPVVEIGDGLEKNDVMLHAEEDVLGHVDRHDLWNSCLYLTHLPCKHCARLIVTYGVDQVVCLNQRGKSDLGYDKGRLILERSKVKLTVLEKAMTDDEAKGLLDDIDNQGRGLTDWEAQFTDEMLKQDGNYTKTQKNKIKEIADQRT